jgi:hypothetical protein
MEKKLFDNLTQADVAGRHPGRRDRREVDPRDLRHEASKSVGNFDISANSAQSVKTSVNGVNTRAGEDPRKRALQASAAGIANYIASHRAGAPTK